MKGQLSGKDGGESGLLQWSGGSEKYQGKQNGKQVRRKCC
jgi:hypothetical protein